MFSHLHSHTEASIADGLFHPKKWIKALKEKKFQAHAITDHGVMTYLIPFYNLMKAEGLIPILGVEFYYVDDPLLKEKENRKASHLILLAKNYEGFKNLMELSRRSFTEGFYYFPRIGFKWLEELHEGLVCSTACQGGVLGREALRNEGEPGTKALTNQYRRFQGLFRGDFYVEFQGHAGEYQKIVNQALYGLRYKTFKPIITNDNHYIYPEDHMIQVLLKKIAYKSKNADAATSYAEVDSLWLKTPAEVYETFRKNHEYLPKDFVVEGMKNTQEVLEKCKDLELPSGKRYLPIFRETLNSWEVFKKVVLAHFKVFLKKGKLRATKEEYILRFKKEYEVIKKYHLEDYFLIVWDLVRFARKKGIYTGLGRGSAAGSLISYLLGIVKIDPLEYGLIFERFLNENRCKTGELPDIDLDFESERRSEIKEYIFKTYGHEKVCEIGTYGRMKLRTALIDFGKAMKIVTQSEILAITTKLQLDKDDNDSLEAAIGFDSKLKDIMLGHLDYAFAVENVIGQIKSQAIHPAGLVICSQPISEITPLKTQKSKDLNERVLTTQAEDKYVIGQGLMKMDILGLKEYDIVKYVIENAPDCPFTVDNYVERIFLRRKISKKVWEYFREGKTEAVFQFSSDGMQELLRNMQPNCIDDLIAANALYRPGCLENGWHIQYCDRKHGREAIEYPHEDVKKALGGTYGVIVFQEQFMEVIHKLGGVSLVDSDTIRSALGKKDKEKLESFRSRFIEGAASKIGSEESKRLWEQIEKASGYTFNKSHSTAYSVLAFISQYLKIHWPTYFWAAHLDWDTRKNKQDDMLQHKKAAEEMGVEFLLPSINKSKIHFHVEDGKPRWSFSGIKGIGPKTAIEIDKHQPYAHFEDFYKRVNKAKVKFNCMVNLIHAGAFDEFGDRKEHLNWLYETKGKKKPKLTEEKMMNGFLDIMGFLELKLKKVIDGFSDRCVTEQELKKMMSNEHTTVGGMIVNTRIIKTKKNESMCFSNLVDKGECIQLTFFPATWLKYKDSIQNSKIVEVEGRKSDWQGKENLIEVKKIIEIN